jgi:NAD(P)-dependent dehydrogenase (short-subunit alcohol dehydrogenase family)
MKASKTVAIVIGAGGGVGKARGFFMKERE